MRVNFEEFKKTFLELCEFDNDIFHTDEIKENAINDYYKYYKQQCIAEFPDELILTILKDNSEDTGAVIWLKTNNK